MTTKSVVVGHIDSQNDQARRLDAEIETLVEQRYTVVQPDRWLVDNEGVEGADGVDLGHLHADVVGGPPLDTLGLIGGGGFAGDVPGAEDKGDDADLDVLVDAGEAYRLDVNAGLFKDSRFMPSWMDSSSSSTPPGSSQRPLSRRCTTSTRSWSSTTTPVTLTEWRGRLMVPPGRAEGQPSHHRGSCR